MIRNSSLFHEEKISQFTTKASCIRTVLQISKYLYTSSVYDVSFINTARPIKPYYYINRCVINYIKSDGSLFKCFAETLNLNFVIKVCEEYGAFKCHYHFSMRIRISQ